MDFFLDWLAPAERYRPRYDADGVELPAAEDEEQ